MTGRVFNDTAATSGVQLLFNSFKKTLGHNIHKLQKGATKRSWEEICYVFKN